MIKEYAEAIKNGDLYKQFVPQKEVLNIIAGDQSLLSLITNPVSSAAGEYVYFKALEYVQYIAASHCTKAQQEKLTALAIRYSGTAHNFFRLDPQTAGKILNQLKNKQDRKFFEKLSRNQGDGVYTLRDQAGNAMFVQELFLMRQDSLENWAKYLSYVEPEQVAGYLYEQEDCRRASYILNYLHAAAPEQAFKVLQALDKIGREDSDTKYYDKVEAIFAELIDLRNIPTKSLWSCLAHTLDSMEDKHALIFEHSAELKEYAEVKDYYLHNAPGVTKEAPVRLFASIKAYLKKVSVEDVAAFLIKQDNIVAGPIYTEIWNYDYQLAIQILLVMDKLNYQLTESLIKHLHLIYINEVRNQIIAETQANEQQRSDLLVYVNRLKDQMLHNPFSKPEDKEDLLKTLSAVVLDKKILDSISILNIYEISGLKRGRFPFDPN